MDSVKESQIPQRFIVNSRVEEVPAVRKAIGAIAQQFDLSDEDICSIELAVGEGLANAVRHGSPLGTEDSVEVTYRHIHPGLIEIAIQDHGTGFDLQEWLTHVSPLSLSDGQRGLVLIAALMDEVSYEVTAVGGRLLLRRHVSLRSSEGGPGPELTRTITLPAPRRLRAIPADSSGDYESAAQNAVAA